MTEDWLDQLKWSDDGLLPVVTQDHISRRILTLAWVNRQALSLAQQEQRAVYWSRSRQQLWRKGEQSGHIQRLHGIYLDCDGDAVIYAVEQVGGIACHTGRESCFYLKLIDGQWQAVDPVLKDPASIYGSADDKAKHE